MLAGGKSMSEHIILALKKGKRGAYREGKSKSGLH